MTITLYKEDKFDPMEIEQVTLENVTKLIVTPECLEVHSRGKTDIVDNDDIRELIIKR